MLSANVRRNLPACGSLFRDVLVNGPDFAKAGVNSGEVIRVLPTQPVGRYRFGCHGDRIISCAENATGQSRLREFNTSPCLSMNRSAENRPAPRGPKIWESQRCSQSRNPSLAARNLWGLSASGSWSRCAIPKSWRLPMCGARVTDPRSDGVLGFKGSRRKPFRGIFSPLEAEQNYTAPAFTAARSLRRCAMLLKNSQPSRRRRRQTSLSSITVLRLFKLAKSDHLRSIWTEPWRTRF